MFYLFFKVLIECLAVLALIYGYRHEQEIIELEQRAWKVFKWNIGKALYTAYVKKEGRTK